MCNHDRAKPEHLAAFPIESYSFPSIPYYYYLSFLTLVSFPPVIHFLCQPCIRLVPYHTLLYHYTSCPYHYDYTQTTPFRSPSLVLPSISSLCNLCIPQSEYHLRYSLWSDPVHVLSLTCPQLTHL